MTTLDEYLAAGVAAARAGQRDQARQHFQAALRVDPRNEMAWLWLSGLVDTPNQKRDCLQRVLAINPNSEPARRGMEQLAQSEAASFLAAFQPRTPPPAPPTLPPVEPEVAPISEPVPIGIDLGSPAGDAGGGTAGADVATPVEIVGASAVPAVPIDLPPPSKLTDAPCVFCGALTGPDGLCAACGMEQIFDCPDCSRLVDLRERMICECGQPMQPFLVQGGIDRDKLGDAYRQRDYPAAAVKQWKIAVATSPRPDLIHRKIAKVYRELGLRDQSDQHELLARQR